MNFRLDLKNLQRIPFEKYNDKFTFVVDGQEYPTSRIAADLLSPIVCRYHFEDETQQKFIINSSDKSNGVGKYFNEFLNLVNYDENYEVDEERKSALSELFLSVGNIDEFYKLEGKSFEKESISRIVELLKFVSSNNKIIESNKFLNEMTSKCASRFEEMSIEELKTLDFYIVEQIFTSSSLHLQDEDSLVETIIELSREDKNYFCLFEYVFFPNVTTRKLEEFVREFDIEYMSNGTWSSICDRLLNRKRNENPNERYIRYEYKEIKHEEGKEFEGIMRHLTRETGGNIHDNGTIEIKSNSIWNDDDDSRHPKNIVDYDKNNFYDSKDESGAFIVFDFKDREIQLTDYSIQSYSDGPNWGNLRNWKLDVSHDGKTWTQVDEHQDDGTLNGSNIIFTFSTKPTESFYRFVKLTSTGQSWYKNGNHYNIYFPYLEFYGKMRRKI